MNSEDNKRALPRYLCSDSFSNCVVQVGPQRYELISLNFNRGGIALFSPSPLPEVTQVQLSFSLDTGENCLSVHELGAEQRYCHDSDVGFQYGFSFTVSEDKEDEATATLQEIETYLAAHTNDEDRYGLFS